MISESVRQHKREHALDDAKGCAEQHVRLQFIYHHGRIVLDVEGHGEHASDCSFWFARAGYINLEHEKLQKDDYRHPASSQ